MKQYEGILDVCCPEEFGLNEQDCDDFQGDFQCERCWLTAITQDLNKKMIDSIPE